MDEERFSVGTIAHFDQQHADALEQLRGAQVFLLATLTPESGELIISIAGPNRYGPAMLPMFVGGVVEAATQFIEDCG